MALLGSVYQVVAEQRTNALNTGRSLPLASNSALETYQHLDVLHEHGPLLSIALATVNARLQQAGHTVQTHVSQPSDRHHKLYLQYEQQATAFFKLWNERELRRQALNDSYKPRIVSVSARLDEYDETGRRDNIYAAFQTLMPGILALNAKTIDRETARTLLGSLSVLGRPALRAGKDLPVPAVTADTSPEQGTENRLIDAARGQMTVGQDGRLEWTSPLLQDENGPWNNQPYYECPADGHDDASYDDAQGAPEFFFNCAAQFPYWLPVPETAPRYTAAVERAYDTILVNDPTGRISMTHILLAETIMTLEQITKKN